MEFLKKSFSILKFEMMLEVVVNLIIRAFLILLLFSSASFSFTEQATIERIIKENRSFVDFMNVSITNFGDQTKVDQFKTIYEMHFNGFVAYLQADYKRAFKRVYESQGKQVDLCSKIVKNLYLEDSKDILDRLAPLIVRSKNAKSRLYLTLGYRDRTVGRNNYIVGMASNPKLHSYKLYKFIKAIKRSRRAKRYGFLALFESQTDEMKRNIYNHLITKEKNEGNRFYSRFLGKSGEAFMEELNKSYSEHRKSLEKGEKKEEEKASVSEKGDTKDLSEKSVNKKEPFETQLEKRVRFRNEGRLAKLLLYFQFDRANDFVRKNVDDLNYKLIVSTFEVLSSENKDSKKDFDYNSFKIHHMDNYSRLFKKSAIDTFVDTIKVEDDIEEDIEDIEPVETEGKAAKEKEDIKNDEKDITDKKETDEKDNNDAKENVEKQ